MTAGAIVHRPSTLPFLAVKRNAGLPEFCGKRHFLPRDCTLQRSSHCTTNLSWHMTSLRPRNSNNLHTQVYMITQAHPLTSSSALLFFFLPLAVGFSTGAVSITGMGS